MWRWGKQRAVSEVRIAGDLAERQLSGATGRGRSSDIRHVISAELHPREAHERLLEQIKANFSRQHLRSKARNCRAGEEVVMRTL